MLSEKAQRIITEETEEILQRVEKIRLSANSGTPNLELYIKTRCDQIKKLTEEIKDKA
jgi:hypothetical protein